MPSIERRRLLVGGGAVLAGGATVRLGSEVVVGESPTFDRWEPPAGTWPSDRYDSANTAANPHASPPADEPSVAWEADIGPGWTGAVVADDTATYAAAGGRVVALDRDDGEPRWDGGHENPDASRHGLCVRDGVVYLLGDETAAFEADTGNELWERSVENANAHLVVPSADTLYCGRHSLLSARDIETGEERWRIWSRGRGPVYPAIDDGRLYVGEPSGLRAFDPRSGWDALRNDGPAAAWDAGDQAFGFAPVVDDGRVFLGGESLDPDRETAVSSHDRDDGSELWHSELAERTTSPAIQDGTAVVGTGPQRGEDAGEIVGLDTETGTEQWYVALAEGTGVFETVVAGDLAIVSTYGEQGGELRAYELASGEGVWTFDPAPDQSRFAATVASLAAVEGTIFAGLRDGRLLALE